MKKLLTLAAIILFIAVAFAAPPSKFAKIKNNDDSDYTLTVKCGALEETFDVDSMDTLNFNVDIQIDDEGCQITVNETGSSEYLYPNSLYVINDGQITRKK